MSADLIARLRAVADSIDALADDDNFPAHFLEQAREYADGAREAIDALSAGKDAPAGVGVKALEWNVISNSNHRADTSVGTYSIEDQGAHWSHDRFWLYIPHGVSGGKFSALEATKAAAQADYERRILSALAPKDAEPTGTGWQDMDNAPCNGSRVLLVWRAVGGLSEHVELGKWKAGIGWCNTYGKPFSGAPDAWASLAPFSHPAPEPAGLEKAVAKIAVLPNGTGVCIGGRWNGWQFRKHPNGGWISEMPLPQVDPMEGSPLAAFLPASPTDGGRDGE